MNADVSFGLMIMAIGMITVFAILSFVVAGGKIMILLINRFAPLAPAPISTGSGQQIASDKIAAITAAVESLTGGSATITEITKEK